MAEIDVEATRTEIKHKFQALWVWNIILLTFVLSYMIAHMVYSRIEMDHLSKQVIEAMHKNAAPSYPSFPTL